MKFRKNSSNNNTRRAFLGVVPAASLALIGTRAFGATGISQEQDFSFVFLGDSPYSPLDELSLQKILEQASPGAAFSIHVGDIKSGTELCTDELLARRIALLNKIGRASCRERVYCVV